MSIYGQIIEYREGRPVITCGKRPDGVCSFKCPFCGQIHEGMITGGYQVTPCYLVAPPEMANGFYMHAINPDGSRA